MWPRVPATVAALQVRRFPETKALGLDRLFVDLDAEPRQIAHRIVGAVEPRLHWEKVGIVKAQLCFGRPGLEPSEIRYRSGEMDGRGRADRAEGIMRHQVYIVRLAPTSDLHRFGEPANIADIEPVELMDATLDVG